MSAAGLPGGSGRVLKFKVVTVGDYAAGKTSIIYRLVKNEFMEAPQVTVGMAMFTKTIPIEQDTIQLDVWDTAGQERMNSLVPMYFRDAHAALIVFDITSKESFEAAKEWVKVARAYAEYEKLVLTFVGNKVDLAANREVSYEEALSFANAEGMPYKETSAKESVGIEELFRRNAHRLLQADMRRDFARKKDVTVPFFNRLLRTLRS